MEWKIDHQAIKKIKNSNLKMKGLEKELYEKEEEIEELKESLRLQEQITKKIRYNSVLIEQ